MNYKSFQDANARIIVSTDLFGRGINIERVNVVINYNFPDYLDQFLHRAGRAWRFLYERDCKFVYFE